MPVDPLDVNFPHVETLIKVHRRFEAKEKDGLSEIGYYISSPPPERYTPEQWLNLIRNHWGGCEIRNHWRKDACLLEDKTRSRNPNVVGTFALLRNILLFFFNEQQAHPTLPGFVEDAVTSPSTVYAMIKAT